jgi:hypothetical protein
VLVMTHGVATLDGRTETDEGLDHKLVPTLGCNSYSTYVVKYLQVLHYFGRMALIESLLPLLRRSPHGRVLSVFAAAHSP